MNVGLAALVLQLWTTDPLDPTVRLQPSEAVEQTAPAAAPENQIVLKPQVTDQTIGGWGASLTESSASVMATLSRADQAALLDEFFLPGSGLGLSILRQPMGAPDFATGIYSYDDVPAGEVDFDLKRFSLARDDQLITPLLVQTLKRRPDLFIVASPWSPPAWMKTGQSMLGASGGVLRDDAFEAYARYFIRFVQGYAERGIPVRAVTPQNEPQYGPPQYPGMVWSAADEGRFIRTLGPLLAKSFPVTEIWGWDHNYDGDAYARALLSDPETARWMSATAWHDYGGSAAAMGQVRRQFPDKDVWMTEGGLGNWMGSFRSQFKTGMRQGIETVNQGSRSYILWNLALNAKGGPIVFPNTANEGLVTIDKGKVTSRNAGYWVLGHFSRFVSVGARRVDAQAPSGLLATAFTDAERTTVVVANPYLSDQTVTLSLKGHSWEFRVPGEGAVTAVLKSAID